MLKIKCREFEETNYVPKDTLEMIKYICYKSINNPREDDYRKTLIKIVDLISKEQYNQKQRNSYYKQLYIKK